MIFINIFCKLFNNNLTKISPCAVTVSVHHKLLRFLEVRDLDYMTDRDFRFYPGKHRGLPSAFHHYVLDTCQTNENGLEILISTVTRIEE
jgi:hypothetical protein